MTQSWKRAERVGVYPDAVVMAVDCFIPGHFRRALLSTCHIGGIPAASKL